MATLQRQLRKSKAAFRTISEVSGSLEVPQHVLRFWETKFTQVKPMKRGGGRRYYRPEDVDLPRRIRALLYDDGYTIEGVQKLLRENGVKAPAKSAPKPPAPAAAGTGSGNGLDAGQRQQLRDVLVELETLRDILRDT